MLLASRLRELGVLAHATLNSRAPEGKTLTLKHHKETPREKSLMEQAAQPCCPAKGGGGRVVSCDVNAQTWPFAREILSWAGVEGGRQGSLWGGGGFSGFGGGGGVLWLR